MYSKALRVSRGTITSQKKNLITFLYFFFISSSYFFTIKLYFKTELSWVVFVFFFAKNELHPVYFIQINNHWNGTRSHFIIKKGENKGVNKSTPICLILAAEQVHLLNLLNETYRWNFFSFFFVCLLIFVFFIFLLFFFKIISAYCSTHFTTAILVVFVKFNFRY